MKKNIILKITVVSLAAIALLGIGRLSWAQKGFDRDMFLNEEGREEGTMSKGQARHGYLNYSVVFETLSQEEKEALEALRRENPVEFKEAVTVKLKAQREYLSKLKQEDSEKYKRIVGEAAKAAADKTLVKKLVFQSLSQEEKDQLVSLHRQDPNQARRIIEQKIEEKQVELESLKLIDSEKYHRIRQQGQKQFRHKWAEGEKHEDRADRKMVSKGQYGEKRHNITKELLFELLSQEEKEELIALRRQDPKKFHSLIEEKINAKKEELENIRESDPEKFSRLRQHAHKRMRQRLEKLKKSHPQEFEKTIAKRKHMRQKKMEKICQDNPAQCEEMRQRRNSHIKSMLEELKKQDPQGYEAIKQWMEKRGQEDIS
ncbi:MAG: hypothetical protein ABH858_02470 [Candidatus Omnitrophota bacterium]